MLFLHYISTILVLHDYDEADLLWQINSIDTALNKIDCIFYLYFDELDKTAKMNLITLTHY